MAVSSGSPSPIPRSQIHHWDEWVESALSKLHSRNLIRHTRPINLPLSSSLPTFDALHTGDRSSVDVPTFRQWLRDLPAPEGEPICEEEISDGKVKLVLFSGNDYLGLSSHPAVRKAAAEVARDYGMGPRGSALICGYTDYHRVLEAALADLKKKEDLQGAREGRLQASCNTVV